MKDLFKLFSEGHPWALRFVTKQDVQTITVIWSITGHFLHLECVRKILKGFYGLFGVEGKETISGLN